METTPRCFPTVPSMLRTQDWHVIPSTPTTTSSVSSSSSPSPSLQHRPFHRLPVASSCFKLLGKQPILKSEIRIAWIFHFNEKSIRSRSATKHECNDTLAYDTLHQQHKNKQHILITTLCFWFIESKLLFSVVNSTLKSLNKTTC